MSSQGVVLAAVTAVVSGTVFLLALGLKKSLQFPVHHDSSPPTLRSCLSSSTSDEKKKNNKKEKKRVHFAEDVVVSSRTRTEEKKGEVRRNYRESKSETKVRRSFSHGGIEENRGMPANRVALYNGILRDRMAQRLSYSY
ncbi:hypothetical protein QN277_026260 [Acacia crassicarpa]|uniref:Uncharacterized protein n=1 Tax=Acacia crassicarpa TaxID=499986 RepID=A0AAE1K491_9FABA|nr:hypothetical protein QN277_026260 [Acacia crassicarpa]